VNQSIVYFLTRSGETDSSANFRIWESVGVIIDEEPDREIVIPWHRVLEIQAPPHMFASHAIQTHFVSL
jgi:hypothetical protein